MALAASAALRWQALVVTAAGMAISACCSRGRCRLADRGAVAAMVLPACYVGVPYLTGIFAAPAGCTPMTCCCWRACTWASSEGSC